MSDITGELDGQAVVPVVADLPPFSGPCPPCPKCGLPRGKAVGTTVSYRKAGDVEWVKRGCGHCGFSWLERCADADFEPCVGCGGFVGKYLGPNPAVPKCDGCRDREAWESRRAGWLA